MVHGAGSLPTTFDALDEQIRAVRSQTERFGTDRQRVDAEIRVLVGQRGAAQRRLEGRVSALYRMRRAGLLPLAGGFDALLRHQSRMERLERMVARDIGSLRHLEQRVVALRQETARVAVEAERADRALSSLQARRGELERAALGAYADPSYAAYAEPPAVAAASFVRRAGDLPLPVQGNVSARDAEREGGAGLELSVRSGSAVRAVAPGRVAFSANHTTYGRLVIVDHEGGYYTVYGGLGAIRATVGEQVEEATVLGAVGSGPLFFQIRQGTRPLAVREWLRR
jgi:septal ring factor EnvC (AmiA/AmiB activator)